MGAICRCSVRKSNRRTILLTNAKLWLSHIGILLFVVYIHPVHESSVNLGGKRQAHPECDIMESTDTRFFVVDVLEYPR